MTDEPGLNSRYSSLKKQIARHDDLYFNQQAPTISDAAYDELYEELVAFEKKHPELVSTDSPTQCVGAPVTNTLAKIRHKVPMLSLDKAYDLHQTQLFFDRCAKETGHGTFLATPKLDGVAVVIGYLGHELAYAATRGDGRQGEDVTANLRLIANVPARLPPKLPGEIELRGEVTMTRAGFARANALYRELGLKEFVNPRNAASGILRSKYDVKVRVLDGLSFTAFWAIEPASPTNEAAELFERLEAGGVPVATPYAPIASLAEFESYLARIEGLRAKLKQDIDGVVLRLGNQKALQQMGTTAKFSRGMLAYKFSDQQKSTILTGISYQLGRTGKLTPVGELEPIELGGVVVRRVSLHNLELIDKHDLHLGDRVTIVRSGEVIPKLVGVDAAVRAPGATKVARPEGCASCAGPLERRAMDLICQSKDCPQVRLAYLRYFVSRAVMDIDGLGPEILEELVTAKKLRHPAEIFALDETRLDFLESSVGKDRHLRRDNLLAAIAKARATSLWRVLAGLGLAGVGQTGARELERYVGKLERIRRASPEVLCFVPSITFADALGLCDFLAAPPPPPPELATLTLSFSQLVLDDKYAEALARRTIHPAYAPYDQIEALRRAGVSWEEREPKPLACSSHGLLAHLSYLRKVYPQGSCWPKFSETFLRALLRNVDKAPTIEELNRKEVLGEIASAGTYRTTKAALDELVDLPQYARLRAGMEEAFNLQWGLAPAVAPGRGRLAGQKVLITGALPGLDRQAAKQLVESCGAEAVAAVSAKVDLVVVGAKPGVAKLAKAAKLGLKTISAEELLALLEGEAK